MTSVPDLTNPLTFVPKLAILITAMLKLAVSLASVLVYANSLEYVSEVAVLIALVLEFAFFLVVLTHAHTLSFAHYLMAVFANIVLHFANMTLANVPKGIMTGLWQRLDVQAIKCLELQYLIMQQGSKIALITESHRELQCIFDCNSGYIIKYMRAHAYKERNVRELNEKLPAVYDDCDNKSKEIASLKYNEEQYREKIKDLRAELGLRAE